MRLIAIRLVVLLAAVASLVVFQSAARAQNPNPPGVDPQHYWTYHDIPVVVSPQPVAIQDQFLPVFVPNTVDHMEHLVNWVKKIDPTGIVSPVTNPDLHYTWWNLLDKVPVNKFVEVTNQFGDYPVYVYNLEFLLVPAHKNFADLSAPPPIANHYACYRADGFPSPNKPYGLVDEFKQDQQIPGPIQFLCVPCWKQHNGQTYPPVDLATHLALYPIQPLSPVFQPFVIDQFFRGPITVNQTPPEYLMVPSLKTEIITDTKKSSWGKIKLLYR